LRLSWRLQRLWAQKMQVCRRDAFAIRPRTADAKSCTKESRYVSTYLAATAQPASHATWGWLRVLLLGLSLFVVTTIVMFATGNPNLYPTVILIGNFLVPIVFVPFLYDHQHLSALSPATIVQSFALGGVLGVLGASVLEPLLIPLPSYPDQGLSLSGTLLAGLIEEGCKITVVALLARRMRHTAEIDGLLLGAAIGMGFAALESTGYAFTALLASHGFVGASIAETVLRGVLAPLGHGVWTAS
jgi:RsiW-degrading membrane proteinase PrsW (M82 family)